MFTMFLAILKFCPNQILFYIDIRELDGDGEIRRTLKLQNALLIGLPTIDQQHKYKREEDKSKKDT